MSSLCYCDPSESKATKEWVDYHGGFVFVRYLRVEQLGRDGIARSYLEVESRSRVESGLRCDYFGQHITRRREEGQVNRTALAVHVYQKSEWPSKRERIANSMIRTRVFSSLSNSPYVTPRKIGPNEQVMSRRIKSWRGNADSLATKLLVLGELTPGMFMFAIDMSPLHSDA